MSLKKRGISIVLSLNFLIIFLSQSVNAALPFLSTVEQAYTTYYGWVDFFVYLIIFGAILRHTIPRIFSKDDTKSGEVPKSVVPVLFILTFVFSLVTAVFTTRNQISLLDLGPAGMIFLGIALLLWIWGRFKGSSETGAGKFLKKISSWGLLFGIILFLLIMAYFFPQLLWWVPGGWGDDLLLWLGILALLYGFYKLFFGGEPKEKKDKPKKEKPIKDKPKKDPPKEKETPLPNLRASIIVRSDRGAYKNFKQGTDKSLNLLANIEGLVKGEGVNVSWTPLKEKVAIIKNSYNQTQATIDTNQYNLKKRSEKRGVKAVISTGKGRNITLKIMFHVIKKDEPSLPPKEKNQKIEIIKPSRKDSLEIKKQQKLKFKVKIKNGD